MNCLKDDCSFVCDTLEQLLKHLNSTHVRCQCGKILNYDELPPDPEPDLCPECLEEWYNE